LKEGKFKMEKIKLGILISGRGSNLKAIYKNIKDSKLKNVEITCVISNKDSEGYQWAVKKGLKAFFIDSTKYEKDMYEELVKVGLKNNGVQLVILAGYMKLVGKILLDAYPDRILNIHPSLLPAFQGLNAYKQALDRGVWVSGVTVHIVDAGMDTGKIVQQESFRIYNNDTLEAVTERGLEVEHWMYSQAIEGFIIHEMKSENKKVNRIHNINTGMSNCI
jgi:phosphoribosylglycinamide formyltransferase-1